MSAIVKILMINLDLILNIFGEKENSEIEFSEEVYILMRKEMLKGFFIGVKEGLDEEYRKEFNNTELLNIIRGEFSKVFGEFENYNEFWDQILNETKNMKAKI